VGIGKWKKLIHTMTGRGVQEGERRTLSQKGKACLGGGGKLAEKDGGLNWQNGPSLVNGKGSKNQRTTRRGIMTDGHLRGKSYSQ